MADILEMIANPTTPADVARDRQSVRAGALNIRGAEQNIELNQMKIDAAKKGPSAKDRLEEMSARAQLAFQSLKGVRDEQTYRQAQVNLKGLVDLPDAYDPKAVEFALADAAMGIQGTTEFAKAYADAEVLAAQGNMEAAEEVLRQAQAKYSGKDEPKMEAVYDVATGESRGTAVIRGGRMFQGGNELDPSKYTIEKQRQENVNLAGTVLPKPTQNKLTTDISEGKVQQVAFKRIKELYNKDFLTLQGKVKGGFLWGLDKIDALPEGQQKEWLAAKTKFDTGVNQAFNIYRRWVTGAAAAMSELERLEQAYINTKDSPTQFMAKLAELGDFGKRVEEVRMQMLKNGLSPDDPTQFDTAWKTYTVPVDEDPTTQQELLNYLQYKTE